MDSVWILTMNGGFCAVYASSVSAMDEWKVNGKIKWEMTEEGFYVGIVDGKEWYELTEFPVVGGY